MRYVLKQRFWALGDDFSIKDEHGQDVVFVDGKVFSFGDSLTLRDMQGSELATINQRLLSWGPTYEIHRGGRLAAVVKKSLFTLFRYHFTVDVPGPDDLEAQGDFLDHEYTFTRHGQPVATVSKRWFSFNDTYGIEVAPGDDDLLILACAVVIDLVANDDKQRNNH